MTFDACSDKNDYYRHAISFEQKIKQIPEANGKITTSGTNSPYSSSDKNIDLVGVPFVNKAAISGGASSKQRKYAATGGGGGGGGGVGGGVSGGGNYEHDLSTPYNYYRCLPPAENPSSSKFVSKFLKRQFSVDKSDESTSIVLQEVPITKTSKLFKQNSAGANHENDKTEKSQVFRFAGNNNILPSLSISSESLS